MTRSLRVSLSSSAPLVVLSSVVMACAELAPVRPLAPDHDPATADRVEAAFEAPANPLTREVPDGPIEAGGDPHTHDSGGHEAPKPDSDDPHEHHDMPAPGPK